MIGLEGFNAQNADTSARKPPAQKPGVTPTDTVTTADDGLTFVATMDGDAPLAITELPGDAAFLTGEIGSTTNPDQTEVFLDVLAEFEVGETAFPTDTPLQTARLPRATIDAVIELETSPTHNLPSVSLTKPEALLQVQEGPVSLTSDASVKPQTPTVAQLPVQPIVTSIAPPIETAIPQALPTQPTVSPDVPVGMVARPIAPSATKPIASAGEPLLGQATPIAMTTDPVAVVPSVSPTVSTDTVGDEQNLDLDRPLPSLTRNQWVDDQTAPAPVRIPATTLVNPLQTTAQVVVPTLDGETSLVGLEPLGSAPAERQIATPSAPQAVSTAPERAQAPLIASQLAAAISRSGGDRVEIRLDPPELGRVSLTINITEQAVTAVVSADRPDIADLMRRHADLLQQDLAEAGFGNVDLEFTSGEQREADQETEAFVALDLGEHHDRPGETLARPAPAYLADGHLDIRL